MYSCDIHVITKGPGPITNFEGCFITGSFAGFVAYLVIDRIPSS